ncbi:MAG: dihydrodipicolinate synthase family protein [Burkholderiales bacterium]
MTLFNPGLVHSPLTPFKADQSIDYDLYAKVIEFHLKNGAEALAVPMPEGEDMSLRDPELREIIAFAIKQVKGRVPVIAHISDAGTAIAVERALFAEKAGAAAIVSHPPYFWHPKPGMVTEHLVRIGNAIKLPFYVCNPPVESVGTTLSTDIVMQLIDRVPNLHGVVDASLDFVFMEEVMCNSGPKRPGFQLLAGQDYPVAAYALGGSGLFASLACIAPKLVKQVYDLCKQEKYLEARGPSEQIAELHHLLKNAGESGLKDGLAGIKAAMAAFGRPCGGPRPPVRALGEIERGKIAEALAGMAFLKDEPRGW